MWALYCWLTFASAVTQSALNPPKAALSPFPTPDSTLHLPSKHPTPVSSIAPEILYSGDTVSSNASIPSPTPMFVDQVIKDQHLDPPIRNFSADVSEQLSTHQTNTSSLPIPLHAVKTVGNANLLAASTKTHTLPESSSALSGYGSHYPLTVYDPWSPSGISTPVQELSNVLQSAAPTSIYQQSPDIYTPTPAPTPVIGAGLLWGKFEQSLLARGTRFEDLAPDTDWSALLTELGFDPLSAGRLLFVIHSQPRVSVPALLRAHEELERLRWIQETRDATNYQHPMRPIRPVIRAKVGSDPAGWWWGGNDHDYFAHSPHHPVPDSEARFRGGKRKQTLSQNKQSEPFVPHQTISMYTPEARRDAMHRPASLPGVGDVQWYSNQPNVPFADPVPVPEMPQDEDTYNSFQPPATPLINEVAALSPLHNYPDARECCSGSTTWCCGTTSKWNGLRILPQPDLNTYGAKPIVTIDGWKDTLMAQQAAPIIAQLNDAEHLNLKLETLSAAQTAVTAAASAARPVVRDPILDEDESTADYVEHDMPDEFDGI